jgi:hypothetical protein
MQLLALQATTTRQVETVTGIVLHSAQNQCAGYLMELFAQIGQLSSNCSVLDVVIAQ